MYTAKLFRATPKINSRLTSFALHKPTYTIRPITCSNKLYKEDKRTPRAAERALENEDSHAGAFSRTDNTVQIEHPDEESHPPSAPIAGRGGMHFKRTLASFSLEKRVCVITGGARGLGLVMSQACLLSGADVAIVDLNSNLLPPARHSTQKANAQYRGRGTTSSRAAHEAFRRGKSRFRAVSSSLTCQTIA